MKKIISGILLFNFLIFIHITSSDRTIQYPQGYRLLGGSEWTIYKNKQRLATVSSNNNFVEREGFRFYLNGLLVELNPDGEVQEVSFLNKAGTTVFVNRYALVYFVNRNNLGL
jgi:hypothetical protein